MSWICDIKTLPAIDVENQILSAKWKRELYIVLLKSILLAWCEDGVVLATSCPTVCATWWLRRRCRRGKIAFLCFYVEQRKKKTRRYLMSKIFLHALQAHMCVCHFVGFLCRLLFKAKFEDAKIRYLFTFSLHFLRKFWFQTNGLGSYFHRHPLCLRANIRNVSFAIFLRW